MDNEDIKSVWSECVSNVKKAHIGEVKSFANPPKLVGIVATALIIVLEKKKPAEKDSWAKFKKITANPQLLSNLLHFDAQNCSKKHIEMVKAFLKENGLDRQEDNGRVACVSFAMQHLHQWILNLIEEVEKHADLDKDIQKQEEFQKLE